MLSVTPHSLHLALEADYEAPTILSHRCDRAQWDLLNLAERKWHLLDLADRRADLRVSQWHRVSQHARLQWRMTPWLALESLLWSLSAGDGRWSGRA